MQRHIHADLIIAWATGAQIQEYHHSKEYWVDIGINGAPILWNAFSKYRIKPEPKPDIVRYTHMTTKYTLALAEDKFEFANMKLTFDGENMKLKSAEVL